MVLKVDFDRYQEAQQRVLTSAKALAYGRGSLVDLNREFSRLCRGIAPSPAERAVIVLAKALAHERKQRLKDEK